MKFKSIILSITLLIFYNSNFAQYGWGSRYDPGDVIGEQLYAQVKSVLGEQYTVWYYVLDSMFNKNYTYDEIIDPYNQLQGKVFFISHPVYESDHLYPPYYESSYSRPDSSIVGIFSNGSIIWHSEPISLVKLDTIKYGLYHDYSIPDEIFAIKDINRDGKVDILLMTDALWIISWDGTAGTIINDIDPTDKTSKLLSSDTYRLIFTNEDDIYEILSYWFDYDSTYSKFPPLNIPTRPYVTYGWNGEKYGLWDDVVQIGLNEFPIANKLTGKVSCKVEFMPNEDSSYLFKYTIKNDETSSQNIHQFTLENMTEDKRVYIEDGIWTNGVFDSSGINWGEVMGSDVVLAGEEKSGFLVKSKKLPNIKKFYLQADGLRIAYSRDLGKPYDPLSVINNIRTNSYSGFTIVPSGQPYSLILNNFLDTLLYFNQSSLQLGWIKNQPTANKYDSLFNLAKTQLQQNNNNAARTTLQTVLQEVNIDSTNNLTSEAYALIKYNTEYLLSKLSEQSVLDISLINPAMSLVNPGAFTMEVKGTGFTTNSTVYFNGNARTTTFISDSVLNAQILSTDVSAAGNYPVWVSDGATNSDTLIYKVVSTLPQPVRPVLECVRNNGDGTYTAFFGYKNDNSVSVYIPVGGKNKFTPTPQDRGQPRVFEPGRHYKVFTVNFSGSNLVWTLNGRTSTASSNSAPCN